MKHNKGDITQVRPRSNERSRWLFPLRLLVILMVVMSVNLVVTAGVVIWARGMVREWISLNTFQAAIPDKNTATASPLVVMEFCTGISDTCTVQNVKFQEGVFKEIWAVITPTYRNVEYAIRDDMVKMVDLILIWGEPDLYQFSGSLKAFWDNGNIFAEAVSPKGQFSYSLPVTRVTITDSGFVSTKSR